MITDEPHYIIAATMVKRTPKAFLLKRTSDNEEFWVPQSQCEWQQHGIWAITKWWADQNGVD